MPRDEVVNYLKEYAASSSAPVHLGAGVGRLTASDHPQATLEGGATTRARNVVLATKRYQRPKVPAASATLSAHIQQLHSQDYRRPQQLADGGVLVVGTGQSGAQIAEELHDAGRDVHLAVSMCPGVPRRYRGRDVIRWLLQSFLHGAEVGVRFPPSRISHRPPRGLVASRMSGQNRGHYISLRQFARRGIYLCSWKRRQGRPSGSATTWSSASRLRTLHST